MLAIVLGALIIAASYAGAAYASADPPRGYLASIGGLREYVRSVDSFLNPKRAPLRALVFDTFVHPARSGKFDYLIDAVAALGFAATFRRFGTLMAMAMFVPFQLFTWLMLDPFSIGRYATAYLPLYALLAAAGAHVMAVFYIDAAVIAAVIVRLVAWTLPAVRSVRSGESPPVAAMRAILREHPQQLVFVHAGMWPWAAVYLPRVSVITDEAKLPLDPRAADALYVCEGVKIGGRLFQRPHGNLWNIVRQRYFEVTLTTVGAVWRFGDGWYDEEGEGKNIYRWMPARSVTTLPPVGPRARLSLKFGIPSPLVRAAPLLTVALNGRVIDRVRCDAGEIAKSWDIDANPNGANTLVLSIDRTVNPLREHLGGDARDLGLRLDDYAWTAIR